MQQFDLWSDFHHEHNRKFKWKNWKPTSDILVLAGDTSNSTTNTISVVDAACAVYKHVIFCSGNHDYYDNHNIPKTENIFKAFAETRTQVTFLNHGSSIYMDNILFIGDMGWYSWDYPGVGNIAVQSNNWFNHLNDKNFIQFSDLPPDLACKSMEDISCGILDTPALHKKNIVAVTHTVPHIKALVSPSHPWAPLNGSYYNSFMENIWKDDELKPKVWVFGHTHFPCDFTDNDVRFVCAPRGYHGERIGKTKNGPTLIEIE